MSDSPQKTPPDNEQRYMALLALTSQELPKARNAALEEAEITSLVSRLTAEQESLYRRLDADPAALEDYLQSDRRRPARNTAPHATLSPATRLFERLGAFLSPVPARYAAAFGVAAVISLLVISQLPRSEPLGAFVEQSYDGLALYPTQSSLILPWERPPAALGFGPNADNNSVAASEFAQGLLRGKQLLVSGKSSATIESAYAALGEWNVLLWAASESTPPRSQSFWKSQQAIYEKFSAASFDRESRQIVMAHLARVSGIIDTLAAEQSPARNARALTDELLLFREQFAPRDAAVVNGRTPSMN